MVVTVQMLGKQSTDARLIDDISTPGIRAQHIVAESAGIATRQPGSDRRRKAALRPMNEIFGQAPLR
jgi:hypothetical protein